MSASRVELVGQGVGQALESAVLVVDACDTLVGVNDRLCRLLGYGRRELMGRRMPLPIWSADEEDTLRGRLREVQADGGAEEASFAMRLLRRDGTVVFGRMTVTPLVLGESRSGCLCVFADTAASETVMRELRASERRFSDLVRHVPEVVYVTDAEHGRLEFVSPAFETVWGIPVQELYRDVSVYVDAIDPAFRATAFEALERQRRGERTRLEYLIRRPDGSERWIWDQSYPVIEPGQARRIVGVAADITERKRAEIEVRRQADRLAEAELTARLGSVEITLATGALSCSAGLRHLLGLGRSEPVSARQLLRRLLPIERADVLRGIRSWTSGAAGKALALDSEWTFHVPGQHPAPLVLQATARMVSRGVLLVTLQDITVMSRLRARVRRLSQALEQSPDAVMLTDATGRIEYVNTAFVRSTGYSAREVLGRNPSFLKSERTPPHVLASLATALKGGRSWRGRLVNRSKNGHERVVMLSVSPIRDERGVVTHFVSSEEDVTEQDRLEQELTRYRGELEALVAQRTAQLQDALQQAAKANQAKSEFLANVSHEIRTPMNAIVGLVHILMMENPSAAQKEWLKQLEGAGQQLLGVITDVLDLSKIEAGRLSLDISEVFLREVLEGNCTLLRMQAEEKGLSLTLSIDPALPQEVRIDSLRLSQILLNLVGNAVKFTEKGSVAVKAQRQRSASGPTLRVEVRDTGIGIPADKIGRLFSPFEQGDASLQRRYGGTGLGLSISRRLVELMGGRIGCESRPGLGSLFWFELPLDEVDEHIEGLAQRCAPAREEESAVGARVLLADDNRLNRRVAAAVLSRHGYVVVEAEDGEQAVQASTEQSFDYILMDLQMPNVDGIQATCSIRRLPRHAETPILAMSGNVFEEDRLRCEEAGMDDFLPKPVRPQTLLAALRRWRCEPDGASRSDRHLERPA